MSRIKNCPECYGQARELLGSDIGMAKMKCNQCGHSWYSETSTKQDKNE